MIRIIIPGKKKLLASFALTPETVECSDGENSKKFICYFCLT